jgi:methyl-accepting chemotaxis protein
MLFNDVSQLIKDSETQRLRLNLIAKLHKQWTDYANALIISKQDNNSSLPNNYQKLFDTQFKAKYGKKINDSISAKFQEFDRHEYKIRGWRRDILNASIIQTQYYSIGFIVLTIIIGMMSTFYIIRIISKRIASMVNLAENISNGQFLKVNDDQNDELTSLSKSLNVMSCTLSKNINELEKRNKELDQFAL